MNVKFPDENGCKIQICPKCRKTEWDTTGKICLNCGYNVDFHQKETKNITPTSISIKFRFKCNKCGTIFIQFISSERPYLQCPNCFSFDVSVVF